jgi:hypothetical protein
MGIEALIGVLGFMGTLLLVLVGLLNFSVFRKQLRIAKEADLLRLIEAPNVDDSEIQRRKELLQLFRSGEVREPIEFTSYRMKRRR